MKIRRARTALSCELLPRDPNVVAIGLSERGGVGILTVLMDGPASVGIPDHYQGFPVLVIEAGAFYGDPPEAARSVA